MAGEWRTKAMDEFASTKETPWPLNFAVRDDGGAHVVGAGDGTPEVRPDPPGLMSVRRPETMIQALMETPPGDEPDQSVEEQASLSEALADIMETLETDYPRLHWVFTAHVNRGLSFKQIGDELNISKTHAHFLYQQAQARLQKMIGDPDELR